MILVDKFIFNPLQENTWLLSNEKGDAIIIDPGCYFTAEEETLAAAISQRKLTPIQLLNTHCHLDHVFGNRWAAQKYRLELYIHPLEEKLLNWAPESGQMWGFAFDNYKGPLHFLNEGQVIKLGDDELSVLLIPGHSPGSIGFYCGKQNFIISGDVLFKESIGRSDLPGGDPNTLIKSIHEQLFTLPDETIVYCGRGEDTTIGFEKKHNPYLTGISN